MLTETIADILKFLLVKTDSSSTIQTILETFMLKN